MESEKKKFLSGNLDQMALSLSGGGVRAVGFHLGTMSMLRRLKLLRNVQILSSVSGGSLPGIGYSLAQNLGRSFQNFFDDFYEFLPSLNILEQLLKGITGRNPPAPSGKRDMITALANTYHTFYFERFFGDYLTDDGIKLKDRGLTFDILMKQPSPGHLEEMIFNATEFKTGTAFRFQVSQYRCLIGNGNLALCRKHAGKIRIADIMAASSCIPVGMEPLFFPDDFHWPDDPQQGSRSKTNARPTNQEIREALQRRTNTGEPNFALMDGGVYDNQGITSTLLALNRRKEGNTDQDIHECGFEMSNLGRGDPPGPEDWANWMSGRVKVGSKYKHVGVQPEDLDLLIISDTPVRKASFFPRVMLTEGGLPRPELLQQPAKTSEKSWFGRLKTWLFRRISVGFVSKLTWLLLIALALSALISVFEYLFFIGPEWAGLEFIQWSLLTFHVILPFVLIVITLLGLITYKRKKRLMIEKLRHLIPNWEGKPGKYIDRLRISDLIEMGVLRAGSTAALTSAIYMDRIRGLGYSTAFSREDLKSKVLANEIDALLKHKDPEDPFHVMLSQHGAWPPPPELLRIVETAATMPTKLWISKDSDDPLNDLDYLVVCGQATICYNLMRYLWEELRDTDDSWIDPKMSAVFEQAVTEWKKLMADPLSLLKDRKRKSRLAQQNEHAAVLEELPV